MSDTTTPSQAAPQRSFPGAVLLLAVIWLGLINQLRVEWSINAQYTYGWGVPFLALYLFWKRWPDRPAPRSDTRVDGMALAAALLLFCLLPIRLVQEANPDWRLVSWVYAIDVVLLSWLAAWFAGGRGWARHFFIPILFILIAVPWPTPLENMFIQGLMRRVAAVTVECVNWAGIPAIQRGNLIELPTGIVGVSEACSGVRSFQATLMTAIFLGELFRFSWSRRLLLIGLGVTLALGLNVVRTFLLTWINIRHGGGALLQWHDPAGYLILFLAFLGLWTLAKVLSQGRREAGPSGLTFTPRSLPLTFVVSIVGWVAVIEISNQAWYGFHEAGLANNRGWALGWPREEAGFQVQKIPEETRLLLRYNEGMAGRRQKSDGGQWIIYFFRWSPGRAAAQLARNHSPEACLPGSGLKLVSALGQRMMQVSNLVLPFEMYLFDNRGKPWYVFFCLWEDHPLNGIKGTPSEDFSRRSRFRAVLEGQRHLGQQVLEIAITGAANADSAGEQVEAYLQQMVRPHG